jgi:chromosome partitioning protein
VSDGEGGLSAGWRDHVAGDPSVEDLDRSIGTDRSLLHEAGRREGEERASPAERTSTAEAPDQAQFVSHQGGHGQPVGQSEQAAGAAEAAGQDEVAEQDEAGEEDVAPAVDAPGRTISPPEVSDTRGDRPGGASTREEALAPQATPRVMALANQKGGVGKTTTAVNLGASLAEMGHRVLLVDLDPQGNATTGLGINARNLELSVYDVILRDVPLEDCIEPSSLRNLFVVPATIDLAGAEIELVPTFSRELKLRRALEPVLDDFDYVLIDCPPSLGLITVNGLAAATEVIVPIQCEYYALEGLGQLLRNVQLVKSNLNPVLEVSAIVLTMFDGRTRLAEQVAEEVRSHFGSKVCSNTVPRTVRLSEAPSFGQPITVFDPTSRGAIAYRELAKEVSGGAPQRTG